MTVSALLEQSRLAHMRYRDAAGKIDSTGKVSTQADLQQCEQAVRDALAARMDAHALDPEHADPAWQVPAVSHKPQSHHEMHDALLEHYGRYLARTASA